MAVTVEDLAAGVRVDNPDAVQLAQITRLLGVGEAYIETAYPVCPFRYPGRMYSPVGVIFVRSSDWQTG